MDLTTPDPHHTLPPAPIRDRGRLGAALPASLTPLVGRTADVDAVSGLIAHGTRLLTLTGPGGVGKTSLALAVAAGADGAFPDGRRLVALAAIRDPALVVPTIIQSLEPRAVVGESPVDQLADTIGERRLLLVLDNLEQVISAGPALARLLIACPNLTILVTSRVVLRLSGEHVVPVAPLPIPGENDLSQIAAFGAIELFVQRARAADPGFTLTGTNTPVVAGIVRRLDGLPLAIELAADRVRSLSPDVILARLDDRLKLLTGGVRDHPDRQRTMRDTIAWSYDLLSSRDKAVFRRLGVFAGGFPLTAVEHVTGPPDGAVDPVDTITALVDASLLRRLDHPGAPRYAMLETVRAYAHEQLEISGEEADTCSAHAEWCIGLADIANFGQQAHVPPDALERLPPEHDNLRAALAWAIGHGETEISLRLVSACARFWSMFAHFREGRLWASRALALPGDASSRFRGRALIASAFMSSRIGELDEADRLAKDGLAIAEAAGDQIGKGRALGALGFIATQSGDYALAATRAEELLDLTRAMGDRVWEQRVVSDLGMLAFTRGDSIRAIALYETALPLVRALDDRALVMHLVGNLAIFLAHQGEVRHSTAYRREALSHARQLGLPDGIAKSLSDTAESAIHVGLVDAGARLLGASNALRVAANVPEIRTGLDDLARLDALFRARMDEAAYRAAQDAGAAMPLADAIAEADRILAAIIDAPVRERADKHSPPDALTPRELDVVRLLAAGKSNREIADALYIGHSTAITHVRHVLHKLDLDSRAAVAAWAVRHGLD